jgi:hypothetical protein
MRKTRNIGIGIGAAAIAATMAVGVASAATSTHAQAAAGSATAVSAVNRHITKAQAEKIAMATVAHSKVHEIESDFRHDRAVWKVQLSTPRGRVIVDVSKKTGQATVLGRGGGGHDDAIAATAMAATAIARPGSDARDNDTAEDRAEQQGDHDNDLGERHGDPGDHGEHGDQRDNDHVDDGAGR